MDCRKPGFPVLHHLPRTCSNSWATLGCNPHNYILWHLLLLLPSILPSIRVFCNEFALCIRGQSIGDSASASVLPMDIQDWFPLGLTGMISLLSKGLSRISNTTIEKYQFFDAQSSLWSNSNFIHDYWKNHSFDYMDLYWQSIVLNNILRWTMIN